MLLYHRANADVFMHHIRVIVMYTAMTIHEEIQGECYWVRDPGAILHQCGLSSLYNTFACRRIVKMSR